MYVCMCVFVCVQVKHVFAESRGRSSDGEDIWKKYSAMATKSRKGNKTDFFLLYTAFILVGLLILCWHAYLSASRPTVLLHIFPFLL